MAKYYEYSIVAPGAFGGGHVATGTSDGLYQIDLWANNIASNFQGFSDQSYMLTASKAGEQYFTFIWDQTPHVYSTSAQTIFIGVGSNNLTVDLTLAGRLWPIRQRQRQLTPAPLPAVFFPTCIRSMLASSATLRRSAIARQILGCLGCGLRIIRI